MNKNNKTHGSTHTHVKSTKKDGSNQMKKTEKVRVLERTEWNTENYIRSKK